MLGFSKIFVVFLFISAVIAIGIKSWSTFFSLVAFYAIIKIIVNFLT